MFIIARACAAVNEGGGRKRRPPARMGRMRGMRRKSQKKGLTNPALLSIISLVPDEHAPIAQLDRAFDYESKGHRFESCWVHHKPLTCFAPLAVFCFALYCWKISRFAACARWAAGRGFYYIIESNYQAVFGFSGRLPQILPQTAFDNIRLSLMVYRFFDLPFCHKFCHMTIIAKKKRPECARRLQRFFHPACARIVPSSF